MASTNQKNISILKNITRKLSTLILKEPFCFLKWLFVLQSLGVSDVDFWKEFYETNTSDKKTHCNWMDELVNIGSLLLYCEVVVSKLKVCVQVLKKRHHFSVLLG